MVVYMKRCILSLLACIQTFRFSVQPVETGLLSLLSLACLIFLEFSGAFKVCLSLSKVPVDNYVDDRPGVLSHQVWKLVFFIS